MDKNHFLELKVLPVLVFLIVVGMIWVSAWFTPEWSTTIPWEDRISTVLSGLGLLFGFGGVASFARARTTTDPLNPEKASTVVSSGVYRVSRNPMYVGLLLFLMAVTVKLGNPTGILFWAVFVAYMTRFQIIPEERSMLAQFGADYTEYKSGVRRWL